MKMIMLSGRIAKLAYSQNKSGEDCVFFDLAVSKTVKGKEDTQYFRFYGNVHFAEVCRKCKAEKGTIVRNVVAEPSYTSTPTEDVDKDGKQIYRNDLLCFIQEIEFGYAKNNEDSSLISRSAENALGANRKETGQEKTDGTKAWEKEANAFDFADEDY